MPLSFQEFRAIWRSQIGDPTQPAKRDTFKKFKHLSAGECEAALRQLLYANPNESKSTLTPKIKHREYLENLSEGKMDLSALALDKSGSLHIVVFERQSFKVGNEMAYRDSLCVKKSQTPGRLVTASEIIEAYKAVQENANDDFDFDLKCGELLQIYSKGSVASLMIVPSFVETMHRLCCGEKTI